MSDDDLRQLLGTLDEIEPAPPELVERVWADVERLVASGTDRPGAAADDVVVSLDTLDRSAPDRRGRRRAGVWLAAAAAAIVAVVAVSVLDRPSSHDRDLSVITTPPVSEPDVPRPETLEAACVAFRREVDGIDLLDADRTLTDTTGIDVWVTALGSLIDDVERLDGVGALDDEVVTLQLLRTAVRTYELRVADDDLDGAATARANAVRHRDALLASGGGLGGCFGPDG